MVKIEDRGPQLRAVAASLYALTLLALLLRCYVRLAIVKAFGPDDWMMLVAMASYTCHTATCLLGIEYGTGRHAWDIPPNDIPLGLKYWWSCYMTYAATMIFSKISIGCFLLRIVQRRSHRWIIYVAMSLSTVWGAIFFLAALFQCWPVSFVWDKTQPGHCVDMNVIVAVTYTYSAFSIITDFTFTILPLFLVSRLMVDPKTKAALVPVLSMACLASSAVVVRLAYVDDFRNLDDFLYATVDIALWSQTEQGLGVAAGSLATLRPLLRLFLSRLGLTGGGTSEMPPSGAHGVTPESKHPSCLPHCSSHGSGCRKGPRELYSLGTITRNDETAPGGQTATKELDDQDSDEHDDGEYRIQITSPHSRGNPALPEISPVASQEQLHHVRSYV